MSISINKKEWSQFNEEEMARYKTEVFDFYRNRGFPYYPTDPQYRQSELDKKKSGR